MTAALLPCLHAALLEPGGATLTLTIPKRRPSGSNCGHAPAGPIAPRRVVTAGPSSRIDVWRRLGGPTGTAPRRPCPQAAKPRET